MYTVVESALVCEMYFVSSYFSHLLLVQRFQDVGRTFNFAMCCFTCVPSCAGLAYTTWTGLFLGDMVGRDPGNSRRPTGCVEHSLDLVH